MPRPIKEMPWNHRLTLLTSYLLRNMDSTYLKIWLLLSSWLFVRGAPLAMLQHATSSQSIVFHPQASTPSPSIAGSSGVDQYGGSPPKYEYKYEVSDHQTGDRKSHWESRDGDRVRGAYTLYEPDGALRTVEYTADSLHGFNAVVRRDEPKHSGINSFNPLSNNVHEGYDAVSQSRYSPDRSTFSGQASQGHSGSSGYNPGVGFSVDHAAGPSRGESVKPY
ncbi:pro-resilin-like [Pectinophora gossypiella]|uniref:pro-resilin-like n=1 Tax=Pectinophora gossypiella TaxID=13191 RepID=UPI00214E910B|nr:pro-resilin-like [Pectinophora gossypiella]